MVSSFSVGVLLIHIWHGLNLTKARLHYQKGSQNLLLALEYGVVMIYADTFQLLIELNDGGFYDTDAMKGH